MTPGRSLVRVVLDALDPAVGGLPSASSGRIAELVRERGGDADDGRVHATLERLVRAGRVERVLTEGGLPVYTRPEVLLRSAGVVSVVRPPLDR